MADDNTNEFDDIPENFDEEFDAGEIEFGDAEEVSEVNEPEENSNDAKIEELEKRYLSLYAEYENYRKRSVKEKENLYSEAVADVTSQWLTILDNIERASSAGAAADEASVEKVLQGIDMMAKQAEDILTKIGVKVIECERGTAFDPNFHEAVMHVDDDSLGENEIAAVFQKGYVYKDRVIRHAVVQVAN